MLSVPHWISWCCRFRVTFFIAVLQVLRSFSCNYCSGACFARSIVLQCYYVPLIFRARWCCKCISLPFKLGTYRSASQNAKVKMLKISRRVSRWVRKVGSSRKVDWIKNNALTCFLLIQFVKGQWLFFTQSEPVLRFYKNIFYYWKNSLYSYICKWSWFWWNRALT